MNKSIIDLFEDSHTLASLEISDAERDAILAAKSNLSNNAFLVDNLLDQGFHILPIHSAAYPQTLKNNLKMEAPTLLYAKGNINLLHEPAIAIVGSRNADGISLTFTDNVSRYATGNNDVVVSGFARGVDRQALDSAIKYGGRSIIVLPQGILTFSSGFRQYYKPIVEGRVIVISQFPPNAGWNVGLAMARNHTVYGLANSIYVAQSDSKGGTWEGVKDGLKLKRQIYVRLASATERNANNILIQMGGMPVDMEGRSITESEPSRALHPQLRAEGIDTPASATVEPSGPYGNEERICELLKSGPHNGKEIIHKLNIDWSIQKLSRVLDSLPGIEKYKNNRRVYYRLRGTGTESLFTASENSEVCYDSESRSALSFDHEIPH